VRERERETYIDRFSLFITLPEDGGGATAQVLGIRRSYIISPKTFILTLKRIKNKKTHEKCEEIFTFINQN